MKNLEVPRLLRQHGNGRVVVDVGLAFDALETEAAVANGFNVIGFEPDPPNVAALRKKFARDSRIHVVDLVSGAAAAAPALAAAMWRLPASVLKAKFPPLDPVSGRGTAYIIAAGLDETNGVAHMGGAASKEAHRATGATKVKKVKATKTTKGKGTKATKGKKATKAKKGKVIEESGKNSNDRLK